MTTLLPPIFRFILELVTWGMVIYASFQNFWWVFGLLSIPALAILNYPGDKRPAEQQSPGIMVPGAVRVFVEISSGILGILVTWITLGSFFGIMMIVLAIITFALDFQRFMWMLDILTDPPEYVTAIHK